MACTPDLSAEAGARLHAFAAATVAAWARREALPVPPPDPALEARAGVFVTLLKDGELRGCIGHLEADAPLGVRTAEMAVAAASDDPRFPPLRAAELPSIAVEVSVLTPAVRATPEEVVPGRHGVLVVRGAARGVLLPQVATEYGWGREELLEAACRKAQLPDRAWCDGVTQVFVFEARVWGGAEPA